MEELLCLVVTKDGRVPRSERQFIAEIEALARIEVTSTSEMIKRQVEYSDPGRYAVIVVLGGDGSILKGVSICSPKKGLGSESSANYIDRLGDEHIGMHSAANTDKGVWRMHPVWSGHASMCSVLPMVFAFDHSTKGRLCNIKRSVFEKGQKECIAYLTSLRGGKCVERLYAGAVKRDRFVVNQSIHVMNEIYIFCNEKGFLDSFDMHINGRCVFDGIRCDGMIICTSLGASGYNASANGPLLYAGVKCLVITTVCSPDRKVPSIIVDCRDKISVKSKRHPQKLAAVIDGCLRIEASAFEIEHSPCGGVFFAGFSAEKYHDDFMSAL